MASNQSFSKPSKPEPKIVMLTADGDNLQTWETGVYDAAKDLKCSRFLQADYCVEIECADNSHLEVDG